MDSFPDDDSGSSESEIEQTQEVPQFEDVEPEPAVNGIWGYLKPQDPNGATIPLIEPTVVLGREPQGLGPQVQAVVFPPTELSISKHHASIRCIDVANDVRIVISVESRNPTRVDGENIKKGEEKNLRHGCSIVFAGKGSEYTFELAHRPVMDYYLLSTFSIEKGAFGEVFSARERATQTKVAVKNIPLMNDPRGPEFLLIRELEVMKALKPHPNICQYLNAFRNKDGSLDLVLELVEGGDLFTLIHERLEKENLLGVEEPKAKHIIYQICKGIAHLHKNEVVHRDLKPENILLSSDDPPVAKVADFGMARFGDEKFKTRCGTVEYCAPELVRSDGTDAKAYDYRVDNWGLGQIAFVTLTGSDNLPSETDLDSMNDPRFFNLSSDAADFIKRLVKTDPNKRMTILQALQHPWLAECALADPLRDFPLLAEDLPRHERSEPHSCGVSDAGLATGPAPDATNPTQTSAPGLTDEPAVKPRGGLVEGTATLQPAPADVRKRKRSDSESPTETPISSTRPPAKRQRGGR
ncbi:kinase-like domain-containing protein [Mycena filopes]|nr:kinase-like domain-containing protein [Mycena filopes]